METKKYFCVSTNKGVIEVMAPLRKVCEGPEMFSSRAEAVFAKFEADYEMWFDKNEEFAEDIEQLFKDMEYSCKYGLRSDTFYPVLKLRKKIDELLHDLLSLRADLYTVEDELKTF